VIAGGRRLRFFFFADFLATAVFGGAARRGVVCPASFSRRANVLVDVCCFFFGFLGFFGALGFSFLDSASARPSRPAPRRDKMGATPPSTNELPILSNPRLRRIRLAIRPM